MDLALPQATFISEEKESQEEMKRYIINKYYNFLMILEDFFGGISTRINNHRKRVDAKYWEKYLK
jgi:hypothetical protein